MRLVLIISGLAIGVGLIVLSGQLPRRARATAATQRRVGTAHGEQRDSGAALELRYADYEDEQGLALADRNRSRRNRRPDGDGSETAGDGGADEFVADELAATAEDEFSLGEPALPIADAGTDRILWVGWNEVPLDAGGSKGDGLTYAWRQVTGPHDLTIKDPDQAQTAASGLPVDQGGDWDDAVYEFEVTVTDAYGQQSFDNVRYIVKTVPELDISPRPKRRLAYRDGFPLVHFEAWTTNRADYSESFELSFPNELFIQHIGGEGEFDVSASKSYDVYVHEITLYYQEDQASTWLEFFVDTPDRIPCIVQVGVHWE